MAVMLWGPMAWAPCGSVREYEIYAGFDFANKRAHPDVYTGQNPDPVTIKRPEDWSLCLTMEEAKRLGLGSEDQAEQENRANPAYHYFGWADTLTRLEKDMAGV